MADTTTRSGVSAPAATDPVQATRERVRDLILRRRRDDEILDRALDRRTDAPRPS